MGLVIDNNFVRGGLVGSSGFVGPFGGIGDKALTILIGGVETALTIDIGGTETALTIIV